MTIKTIIYTCTDFFSAIDKRFNQILDTDYHLVLTQPITPKMCEQLNEYLRNCGEDEIPFSRLTLFVSTVLFTDEFKNLMLIGLRTIKLKEIRLAFESEDVFLTQLPTLEEQAENGVYCFPVSIASYDTEKHEFSPLNSDKLVNFQNQVIRSIQFFNLYGIKPVEQRMSEMSSETPNSKEISAEILLTLSSINRSHNSSSISHEYQLEIEQEVQQTLEVVAEQEITAYEPSKGLVGYEDFRQILEKIHAPAEELCEILQEELFANIPKAIKYLSPKAAQILSESIATDDNVDLIHAGCISALNTDTLPNRFVVKEIQSSDTTQNGAWVLDYDEHMGDKIKLSPYTPMFLQRYEQNEIIYPNVQLPESITQIAKELSIDSKRLHNLWVRFDEAGVRGFTKILEKYRQEELLTFITKCYLDKFPQWDRLYEDEHCIQSLERILDYKENIDKLNCFRAFLDNQKDSTQLDLTNILHGFECFWNNWCELAHKNDLAQKDILGTWSSPVTGNPIVYMQRLITILKNSRDLREQLQCGPIDLRAFGPYYASKNEGFKVLSPEMRIVYNKVEEDQKPFNKNRVVYHVHLDDISDKVDLYCLDKTQEIIRSEEEKLRFDILSHRYVGQQKAGISIPEYRQQWKTGETYRLTRYFFLLAKIHLLLVCHERYVSGDIQSIRLLEKISDLLDFGDQPARSVLAILEPLYKKGHYFNNQEGYLMSRAIRSMNSAGFESRNINKKLVINQFFNYLHQYPTALHKYLRYLNNRGIKAMALYDMQTTAKAILDISCKTPIFRYTEDVFLLSELLCFGTEENKKAQLPRIVEFIEAANSRNKNLDFALTSLIQSQQSLTIDPLIPAFTKIQNLEEFDPEKILTILNDHGFIITLRFPKILEDETAAEMPTIYSKLGNALRYVSQGLPTSWDVSLVAVNKWEVFSNWKFGLALQTIPGLSEHILQPLTKLIIKKNAAHLSYDDFINPIIDKLCFVQTFQEIQSFDNLDDLIEPKTQSIIELLSMLRKKENFRTYPEEYCEIFCSIDYESYDCDTLIQLLHMLNSCIRDNQDYRRMLSEFVQVAEHLTLSAKQEVIGYIEKFLNRNISIRAIELFIKHFVLKAFEGRKNLEHLAQRIISALQKNPDDALIIWLLQDLNINIILADQIVDVSHDIEDPASRKLIFAFFKYLQTLNANGVDFLSNLLSRLIAEPQSIVILKVLSAAYAGTPARQLQSITVNNIEELLTKLINLSAHSMYELEKFIDGNKASLLGLLYVSTENLISVLEKEPYGIRDLEVIKRQFDETGLTAAVNSIQDLNWGTSYSDDMRLQMIEAFRFVNRAGYSLPIYNGNAAKDLSNEEIRDIYWKIKHKLEKDPNNIHLKLYALPLIREAMYRTTNECPYLPQMLVLIDRILQPAGHVISNIDTGQGKSLIDMMSATLLYLFSTRVDITTSSIEDAERDLFNYRDFLSFLNIPTQKDTIISSRNKTSVIYENFKLDGVNFSTLDELGLIYSMAIKDAESLRNPDDVVSLVMCEADQAILDNLKAFRLASSDGPGLINQEDSWLYADMNLFVQDYSNESMTKSEWLLKLRNYLSLKAREHNRNPRMIKQYFDDDKLWSWLVAALAVADYDKEGEDAYSGLKKDIHFVLVKKPDADGNMKNSGEIAIVLPDGSTNKTLHFNQPYDPILRARLNLNEGSQLYPQSAQTQTIIATNNTVWIDYYAKSGLIYGSTATSGSKQEINYMSQRFRFRFCKFEPYQPKITIIAPQQEFSDESTQFENIITHLSKHHQSTSNSIRPVVVFFDTIKMILRFQTYLEQKGVSEESLCIQYYFGYEDRAKIVEKASNYKTVTITTPALGRNTNILYSLSNGMDLIIGFYARERDFEQMIGRTGRQGSPGNIYQMYNASQRTNSRNGELFELTEYRENLYLKASEKRKYNDDLYEFLFKLLDLVELDSAGYSQYWSPFYQEIEKLYHQHKQDRTYEETSFRKMVIDLLYEKIPHAKTIVNKDEFLTNLKDRKHDIHPAPKPTISEISEEYAIPPEFLSYYFLQLDDGPFTEAFPNDIQTKLRELLNPERFNQLDLLEKNREFIELISTKSSGEVQQCIQSVLPKILENWIRYSKSSYVNGVSWWHPEKKLHTFLQNKQFLHLFKAMMHVSQTDPTSLQTSNKAITTALIDEYLNCSWFVSSSRRKACDDLKEALNAATSMNTEDLLNALQSAKCKILREDRETNTSYWFIWRWLFPINPNHRSRLQETLDLAITIGICVGNQKIDTSQLETAYKETLSNPTETGLSDSNALNLFSFLAAKKSAERKDVSSAKIMEKSLESALSVNRQVV